MKTGKISILCLAGALLFGQESSVAQSSAFKQGQWMEIQNAIMRNVTKYYVDSLPLDRMYKDGIDAMLSDLDPYTIYVPEKEQEDFELMISNSYGGIGAIIYKPTKESYVIINEPYEGSPAAKAGLQCGDQIMKIDGESVIGLDASKASAKMKGKPGTKVVFSVKKVRSDAIIDYSITRERIHIPDLEYYGMLDDKTGYIYQTGFTAGVSLEVAKAVTALKKRGMQRLILDLRGNGGGLLDEAVKIVSLFVPKNTLVVSSKGTDGEYQYCTQNEPLDEKIPLMVMVNSNSASASEIVAGAIQDLDRGVVAGHRTFGKGLVQKVLPIAYNGQLKVTVAKYYTPSGRCVQAKDYSHRAKDGSVGNIPDSLTREFKTLNGRTVRDGGGITPDIVEDAAQYSRIAYAAVYSGLTNNWPLEYVKTHQNIPAAEVFRLSDEEYASFVEWASSQKFDSRSESETYYDMLVKQLKKDGAYEELKDQLEAVEKVIKMDTRTALEKAKDELKPILEEEVVVRYWYQPAGIKIRLRVDEQLKKSMERWNQMP